MGFVLVSLRLSWIKVKGGRRVMKLEDCPDEVVVHDYSEGKNNQIAFETGEWMNT